MTLSAQEKDFLKGDELSTPLASQPPDKQEHPSPEASLGSPFNGYVTKPPNRAVSLRSVTLRLHPDVAALLRQAAIERSLEYDEPYTQQGIAEQALREWLVKNGYESS